MKFLKFLLVGKERANFSAINLFICCFCLDEVPLPLGVYDRLRYSIVALPEPSEYFNSFVIHVYIIYTKQLRAPLLLNRFYCTSIH